MIRFSWLQFRAQAAVAAAALAVFAVILTATGPHLFHLYDTSGVNTCQAHGDCMSLVYSLANTLPGYYGIVYFLAIGIMFAVPVLIGTFWGAPLVTREFETGTVRLAWTQGVTRGRWLIAKLAVVGLGAMATAGLFSLLLTWWAGPIDTVTGLKEGNEGSSITFIRLGVVLFATRDITPIGYAAFAFALGVTAGVLIRRTLPAIAVTLGVFAAVQVAWPLWVRAHLITPAHTLVALTAANIQSFVQGPGGTVMVNPPSVPGLSGAWILSFRTIDPAGHAFNVNSVPACAANGGNCGAALGALHLRDVVTYQPGSRFWAFQWYETGIFVALALVLAGFCYWRIQRRRLS